MFRLALPLFLLSVNNMTILSIINELAADNSRLAKESILKREVKNELLKRVLVAALNPYVNYYQKKIPERVLPPLNVRSLTQALDDLSVLSSREKTGNDAIDYLVYILSATSHDDSEVIERIIERDLKCGVSEATVNKIWPGLIPTFDVCLCHKDTSGIKYPAYAQSKSDGARVNVFFDGANVSLFSRQGKEFFVGDVFYKTALKTMKAGEVFDGELIFVDDSGNVLDRKTGNGLANKASKGTLSASEANRARIVLWDIVDATSSIKYQDRFNALSSRLDQPDLTMFSLIETQLVYDEQGAQEFFEKQIAAGQEGAVIKNINALWVPKRSKDYGKMKAEEDCTLEVIEAVEGTGKNVGKLGALTCKSKCGTIIVNVGGGFSDDEREQFWTNPPKFIDVLYNQVVSDKKTGQKSLFLPRFLKERFDKTEADTF